MNYVVYDNAGTILRTVICSRDSSFLQAADGEFVMEGIANDSTQKVINGKIVDKEPDEIVEEDPISPDVPFDEQSARVTNKQWQTLIKRITDLENK